MSGDGRPARTPAPSYDAVIFTSTRTEDDRGYSAMAARREEMGSRDGGVLGIESARGTAGLGITVSCWRDEASILAWKRDAEHQHAQPAGRETWYGQYEVRIAKGERAYGGPEAAAGS